MEANPIISLVSGTYNRLDSLKRMIASVRATIPPGIAYDLIIVDGGSNDGTLEWCRVQSDIKLIEHGELRGAIKAFCDGAKAATGDYVLLANDDITFEPEAIVKALIHLETHPGCGAVAFEDNRPAPGYDRNFHIQTFSVVSQSGAVSHLPYAQIGLFRRWLGDVAGWWGADDEIMGQGHTYGGDNYLSARIWELGYTVEAVPGARAKDRIVADRLRETNWIEEQKNPAVYYKRYPNGPRIPDWQQLPNQQTEQTRILYLPIFEPGNLVHKANKRGLRDALACIGIVYELDYLNVRFDLPDLVSWFKPHLMLTQLHGANEITAAELIEVRNRAPGMVVVNWNGDAHLHSLISERMLELLQNVDLQLVVNTVVLPTYEQAGINAAYWQIGYEEPQGKLPPVLAHDVVFLGNNYNQYRAALGKTLRKLRGVNVGLYGIGWQPSDGNTLYDFAAGEALYQKCKIAISDTFHGETLGFVSNRLIQALAAGAFVLQEHSIGLDEYTGLQDGIHYVSWTSQVDLKTQIQHYLANKAERDRIGSAGQSFIREQFSFDAQVRRLFTDLIPSIRERERVSL